mmetsp:Transcript_9874/g.24004  ORF Transcript_9874/g.24004 Transcript_9874/m.24004 type:complete len:230 (-) Transcript_9874:11-700(-)
MKIEITSIEGCHIEGCHKLIDVCILIDADGDIEVSQCERERILSVLQPRSKLLACSLKSLPLGREPRRTRIVFLAHRRRRHPSERFLEQCPSRTFRLKCELHVSTARCKLHADGLDQSRPLLLRWRLHQLCFCLCNLRRRCERIFSSAGDGRDGGLSGGVSGGDAGGGAAGGSVEGGATGGRSSSCGDSFLCVASRLFCRQPPRPKALKPFLLPPLHCNGGCHRRRFPC